jgi:hypothetical protein
MAKKLLVFEFGSNRQYLQSLDASNRRIVADGWGEVKTI